MASIPRQGRVIALDWGVSRIGVAVSDETQLLATPLTVLTRRAGKRLPLGAFLTVVEGIHPVGLLVGLALDDQGKDTASATAAREMATIFSHRSKLPLEFTDESFSTVTATEYLTHGGIKRAPPKIIDSAAAAVILQSWLDQRRSQ